METLKERKEINQKDCWDLTKVISNKTEYQTLIKEVQQCNEGILKLKGHLLDDAETLYQYLLLDEEESRKLGRLIIYTRLHLDEDTRLSASKKEVLEIENLSHRIHESESFVISEFMEKDFSYVQNILKQKKELEKYHLFFERLYKDKERILSEKEEKLIALASSAFGTPENAFDALDITDAKFGIVSISPRKKVELTSYNYGELLEHENQEVRKEVFQTFYKYYEEHKNTFSALLKGNYQELEFFRTIRKYPSALEMELDSIDVTKSVYDELISSVHQYMNLNIDFQKIKKELLGVKEYHLYDTYAPVVKPLKTHYKKEDAIQLVLKALAPLGEDYLKHFQFILENQTVDFYPNKGKHTGAYQWGCFDSPSYVLLNFTGNFESVSTLAHEMGHAVHSMYSKDANPYIYSQYEIFLAEIASTVNETLLSFYALDHAKKKEEKIYYLCEFLNKVKATIYRQTMFSEFECLMSEKMQNHESLTEEVISNTYYELNETYFEDSVILDNEIRYEWMRISHFYTPFYVYQYATGLISALCIVSDLLGGTPNFQEKYIEFLKGGSHKNVLDLLKDVSIDLTTKEPFEKAFHLIGEKLEELKKLVKDSDHDE